MFLRMNRRYLVTVPSGVKLCYITIRTRREQMIWDGFVRAGTCTLTSAPLKGENHVEKENLQNVATSPRSPAVGLTANMLCRRVSKG
jgi:hypothetical protein